MKVATIAVAAYRIIIVSATGFAVFWALLSGFDNLRYKSTSLYQGVPGTNGPKAFLAYGSALIGGLLIYAVLFRWHKLPRKLKIASFFVMLAIVVLTVFSYPSGR